MKTLFNTDGNLKVTGNREQSVINVTLDFWNSDSSETTQNGRFMEVLCKVKMSGFSINTPAKRVWEVKEVFNPIMNPDSKNPTLLFPQRSDNFDLDTLKIFFSETLVKRIERSAINIAERHNAPENEMLTIKNF